MAALYNQRLEIDALRALLAIRHHGGVTRAAQSLGLSQSAISHKIRRLETSLGCELLGRKNGGDMFTRAGEELLNYATRILGLHDEAVLSLARTSLTGRIALGLTEDTACTDLAMILGRFRRIHPQVSVRTKVRMSLVLREMLDRGELDAAILQIFAHEVLPSDTVLYREQLHWVKHSELSIPPTGAVPFLSFGEDCFYREWALRATQDGSDLLETVYECPSAAGIVAAVLSGLGVAVLNDRHIRPEMEKLSERLPAPPALAYVVRHRRKAGNPALRSLIDEIERQVGRYGSLTLAG